MELMNLLLERRSIRQYTGEPVLREQLEQILQAGLLPPSGRNIKPWEFVVVENKETLARLAASRQSGAQMLENAGCAILVFANREKTDVWPEDCSIAMSNMHLMAHSLGLGSCWVQGRLRQAQNGKTTEEVCRELLFVPEQYALEAILAVGAPAQRPAPHTTGELLREKLHWERF